MPTAHMSVGVTAAMPVISLFQELLGELTIRHDDAQAASGRVPWTAAPSVEVPVPSLWRSPTMLPGSPALPVDGLWGVVAAAAGDGAISADATSAARNSREAGLRTPNLMAVP